MLTRIIDFGAGFFIVMLVANYFGVDRFGEFSFIRAVAFILSPLIAFGSIRTIIREISVAKDRTSTILSAGLTLNVIMTFAVGAIAGGVVLVFNIHDKAAITSIYLAILAQTFLNMKTTINAVFFSHEISHFAAMTKIAGRFLVIAAIVVVIQLHQDLLMMFMAIACANFFGLAIAYLVLKRTCIVSRGSQRLFNTIGFLLKESYPIALVVFLVQGYTYVNIFFLRYFHDNWQVAMFEASQRLILPLSMISTSILLGFVPMLSRLGKDEASHDQLYTIYASTLKYFFMISFPICVAVAVFADSIILLIYNQNFAPAVKSLTILIWTIVPLLTNGLLTFILISLYKQKLLILSNLSCFFVNTALSWLLVRDFGYVGVCYAAFIAYCVLFLYNYHFVSKALGPVRLAAITLIPALVSVIFYYLMEIYLTGLSSRLLGLVVYGIVYGIAMWITGLVDGHERDLIIGFLRRKWGGGGNAPGPGSVGK